MATWQTHDSIEKLEFYLRLLLMFLKPIKIEPVTELTKVAGFVNFAH